MNFEYDQEDFLRNNKLANLLTRVIQNYQDPFDVRNLRKIIKQTNIQEFNELIELDLEHYREILETMVKYEILEIEYGKAITAYRLKSEFTSAEIPNFQE